MRFLGLPILGKGFRKIEHMDLNGRYILLILFSTRM